MTELLFKNYNYNIKRIKELEQERQDYIKNMPVIPDEVRYINSPVLSLAPGNNGLKNSITERAGIQLSSCDYKPEVLKEIEYDLDKCKRDIKAAEILIACLSDIENFIVNSHFIEGLSWITISSKHKEKYNNCIHKALTIEQIKRINKKALKKNCAKRKAFQKTQFFQFLTKIKILKFLFIIYGIFHG